LQNKRDFNLGNEIVIAFSSTNYAIQAETVILEANVPVKVMPLPASIRAGCGICLRISPEDRETVERLMREHNIPIQQMYMRKTENGKSIYTELKKGDSQDG